MIRSHTPSQPLGVAPVFDWRHGLQSHAGTVKYPG